MTNETKKTIHSGGGIIRVGIENEKTGVLEVHMLAFNSYQECGGAVIEIEKPPLVGEGWKDDVTRALQTRFDEISKITYRR